MRGGGRGRGGGGGRGAFYKEKYGNKSRRIDFDNNNDNMQCESTGFIGTPASNYYNNNNSYNSYNSYNRGERAAADLEATLCRLDGKPYGAYKDIGGTYAFNGFTLCIDHVQSDPYAPPSLCIVKIPHAVSKFPAAFYSNRIRSIALCDYLNRVFYHNVYKMPELLPTGGGYHGYKGGELGVAKPSQHVLQRSSVMIDNACLEVRLTASLPAMGRSIQGNAAVELFLERIPKAVRLSFLLEALPERDLMAHILSIEDQEHLRNGLKERGLVAFVRNGAVLPRHSGASDLPMEENSTVKFVSPPTLEKTIPLLNGGNVIGMGINKGITLVVGGGFHGKSTLLTALEVGVYNHVPGDGREFVVCDPAAVKIRAEDGRSVESVNISPFINNLPYGKSTNSFSTLNASGSTSQSANIMEALEVGSNLLLIDEDTSATNFMIRDKRMQMLVAKEKEPITPLVYKIEQLFKDYDVSVILVMGGSGDYFEVANCVIMMDDYHPRDITEKAREICNKFPVYLAQEGGSHFGPISQRIPIGNFGVDGKIKCHDIKTIGYGNRFVDLSAVEQLVEANQTRAIGDCLNYIAQNFVNGQTCLKDIVAAIDMKFLSPRGLDIINSYPQAFYTQPRKFEVAAALNRLREVKVVQQDK